MAKPLKRNKGFALLVEELERLMFTNRGCEADNTAEVCALPGRSSLAES
jgi:hypothetical protein